MRIQELEQMVGADRATIRFYEKEGLLTPTRSENRYRDYSEENAQELKKILLLRQLGMGIPIIKQLQQGNADFSKVLSERILALSDQIEENKRAKSVCQAMHSDGASYASLNTAHYTELLNGTKPMDFEEAVPRQIHPWRRYFARTLDYAMWQTMLELILIVILRIRGFYADIWNYIFIIISMGTFVPIEAWMLSKWGTTPGKWLMGIRIESAQGGHLTWQEAFDRAWNVFYHGTCFGIPILSVISYVENYCKLTGRSMRRFAKYDEINKPSQMVWDKDAEIQYSKWEDLRGFFFILAYAIVLIVGVFIGIDKIKPKYRSENLTIEQFSANYNHVTSILNAAINEKLAPDGSKIVDPTAGLTIDISTGDYYVANDFEYEVIDGYLRSIEVQKSWNDEGFYFNPMGTEEVYLAATALLSQPGCTIGDYFALMDLLHTNQTKTEVELNCSDLITVNWIIDARNCIMIDTWFATDDESKSSSLHYSYTVSIP